MDPLPAAEVRRRGDRRRHRRTTVLAIAGAATAVALIAGGASLVHRIGGDGAPAPAGPPEIVKLSGFPLAEGWPKPGLDGKVTGPSDKLAGLSWEACGARFGAAPGDARRITAAYEGPEDYRSRELRVYGSAGQARMAMRQILDGFRACPVEKASAQSSSPVRTRVLPAEGESSARVVQVYGTARHLVPGAVGINLVVRGPALLISQASGEALGWTEATALANKDRHTLRAVELALCRFDAGGCGTR